MTKKILWLILSSLMVSALVLASCDGEEEEVIVPTEEEEATVPTEEEEVTVPTEEKKEWWDKWGEPEYGGTLTCRAGTGPSNWDPYYNGSGELWYETLAWLNFWGVDHEIFDFKIRFAPTTKYYTGRLAESWEVQDNYQTYIFHIRQGVHWQDIPPVNGRELDAYDIEYNFHRYLGIGSGYTEPSHFARFFARVASVTATDKWTVVFKTGEPSIEQFRQLLDNHFTGSILPKEAIELYGDLNDWTRCIGTGPYMISDYVTDTSSTAVRNPNYWGYDEHFPENRLPYIDEIKTLVIPDSATARAALRTGKLDYLSGISLEHKAILLETNPELQVEKIPSTGAGIWTQQDREPFNDIRVRIAMQMSIDLKTIAATHYGGMVDPTPPGWLGVPGYSTPYEEWPQEVKDSYAYNPEGARQLLAEAGYPDGFNCTLAVRSSQDLDLAQILQYYFGEIGIDMEINVMEPTVWDSYTRAGKAQMTYREGWSYSQPSVSVITAFMPTNWRYAYHHIDDPVYTEIAHQAVNTSDEEEQARFCREADFYVVSNHFLIIVLPNYRFTMIQPWLKNYNGEMVANSAGQIWSRTWIDQKLKESMGY